MTLSITKLGKRLLDMVQIIRLRRAARKSEPEKLRPIQGVTVENLGSLILNKTLVRQVEERWGTLDSQFESLVTLTADALKAVGKHINTDIYLERRILEGAREKDAHRGFIVERREVDRAMLMMIFDREKIEQVKSTLSIHPPASPAFHPIERSRKQGMGSVFDEAFSSECIKQVEHYFNLLFQENSIIHMLDSTRKIVKILRLPYELPKTIYGRKVYPSRSSFGLTELMLREMMKDDSSLNRS